MNQPSEFLQHTMEAKVARFAELSQRNKALKAEIEANSAEMENIEPFILDYFIEAGMQRVTMRGQTVYLHRQLWAKAKDNNMERACAVLESLGLGQYVKTRFDHMQVSAYVREMTRDEQELPEGFSEAFEIHEKISVRVTKG